MKRTVDYTWRLPGPMAAHAMHNSADLIPHLLERGIDLSRPQVYRLVTQVPAPLAVEILGYSYSVAHRHAELAAQPWAQQPAQRK
ncbi:hypothetical protein HT102_09620 [Hoyosella sp. G463]|uniref:Uncharacterized protein n=1 Tax=Lolliginicoccus lacisalsi TaxID=2742202 RepID=A0A927JCL1_9ACTN|nr:hypothetical protein [Lolliginicoccus lacisalsi]